MSAINKTVTIRGTKYQMYQAQTGWLFVRSKKTGRTYNVAQITDGEISNVESAPAINGATNQELAEAWLAQ